MSARIEITYDTEENGATVKKELPFTVGIIGDFTGNRSPYTTLPLNQKSFIHVTHDNLADVFKQLQPKLQLDLDEKNNPLKLNKVNIDFSALDDFKPENIIHNIHELKQLWEIRQQLRELQSQHNYDPSLIEQIRNDLHKLIKDNSDAS